MDGGEYRQETARRDRLVASVDALRRTRQTEAVRIPVVRDVFASRMSNLGAAVQLGPGELVIQFVGPEDLLGKLFALAQAAANDYAALEGAATGAVAPAADAVPTQAAGCGSAVPPTAA